MRLVYNRDRDPRLIMRVLNLEVLAGNYYLWANPPTKIKCFEIPTKDNGSRYSKFLSVRVPGYLYCDHPSYHGLRIRYKPKKEGLCFDTLDWLY